MRNLGFAGTRTCFVLAAVDTAQPGGKDFANAAIPIDVLEEQITGRKEERTLA